MKILFPFILLFSMTAEQPSEMEFGETYPGFVREYQLAEILNDINEGRIERRKLIIIYNILKQTPEWYIHQQRGQSGNTVWLHPDGHKEAVYGPDGKLVQDGINDGSYNYFHPVNQPLHHFWADIHPWIILGNSRKDPTSMEERISSYILDLEEGIRRAHTMRNNFTDQDFDEPGQKEVLALFLSIVKAGDAGALFSLFDEGANINNEILMDLLQRIRQSMTTILQQNTPMGIFY